MSWMPVREPLAALVAIAVLLPACAQGGGPEPGLEVRIELAQPGLLVAELDDWEPLPAGVIVTDAVSEAEACETIVDTYRFRGLDLGCATTLSACPDLLRNGFGASCMQYDAASVDACVASIEQADGCDALRATSCDVVALANTQPQGCPGPLSTEPS